MTAVTSTRHPVVGRRTTQPVLLWHQTRHELVALRRTPITLILSIGLPLLFFVLLSALIGNEVVDERQGVRAVQFLAPGMAAFGVVMATFSFLSIGLAEARATGVVKRQSGAPVPRWVLIGGRMGAALLLGLTSTALVLASGVALYDLQVPSRSLLAMLSTLVLASACFSALGLALAMALPTMQLTVAVSNGLVIPLAFVSDMFMLTGQMPDWLATIGRLFPLKHLTAVFADALNPYLSGSGFELDHLAVIALWGLAGALVATVQLRRDRDRDAARPSRVRSGGARRRRAVAADATPRRTSAPGWVALLAEQVGHTQLMLWRNPSAVFFAVAFPVLLVVIIPAVNGGGDQLLDSGQTLGVFYAGTMAIYGTAVTAYVNMPQGVAEARDRGVLKRTGGTPLPAAALVAGRVVGALGVALLTGVVITVLAGVMFRPTVSPGLPAAVAVLAIAATCFAVVGLAVMTFVHSAQALTGVTLGTLLPLAFISDIFVIGASFPPVLEAVSWVFPLRHASAAMSQALAPGLSGTGLAVDHLVVLLLWTAAAALVLSRRFRWESPSQSGRAPRPGSKAGSRSVPPMVAVPPNASSPNALGDRSRWREPASVRPIGPSGPLPWVSGGPSVGFVNWSDDPSMLSQLPRTGVRREVATVAGLGLR
jgi:ABC-type multidrug transport system permease subunit